MLGDCSKSLNFEDFSEISQNHGRKNVQRPEKPRKKNCTSNDLLSIFKTVQLFSLLRGKNALQVLSLMPALETLVVDFQFSDKLLVAQRKVLSCRMSRAEQG